MTTPKFLTIREAADRTGLSRSSLYRLLNGNPSFLRPVQLSARRVAFVEAEVDAYVAARIALRDRAA